jgi:acyl-coenzyme A synthetase/AMP-(fatty) acid ligase
MEGYINAKMPLIKIKSKYYFPTGDLVFKDKNNNINFYGRKSDYQKISGYRINLSNLEQIIRKKLHFKISLISKKGKIYLFIFFKNIKKNIIKNKLYKIFDKYLEKYEIPSNIYYLKNMPLNSSGKLDKNKLKKMI